MSADNYLLIHRPGKKYLVEDCMSENRYGSLVGAEDTLEEAIKKANKYMKENIVEYGLKIDIES